LGKFQVDAPDDKLSTFAFLAELLDIVAKADQAALRAVQRLSRRAAKAIPIQHVTKKC
jgi:hypothetical protein